MSELFVVNGICGGTVFFLPDVPTVLGRSAECQVQIADPWISSMHAMFEKRGEKLWLVDLESRNGTWVNEQKVREAPLAPGYRLRFGKTEVELREGLTPRPLQPLLAESGTIVRYLADMQAESREAQPPDHPPRRDTDPSSRRITGRGQGSRRQISIVNDIGRALIDAPDLDATLARILHAVATAVRAEQSTLLLMDESGHMQPRATEPAGSPPRISETVVTAAAKGRAGLLTIDAQQDLRFTGSQSVIAQGIRSCLCVPVWADNRILGMLVMDRGFVDPFTADDLELTTLVGYQSALAIERARFLAGVAEEEQRRRRLARHFSPDVSTLVVAQEQGGKDPLEPQARDDARRRRRRGGGLVPPAHRQGRHDAGEERQEEEPEHRRERELRPAAGDHLDLRARVAPDPGGGARGDGLGGRGREIAQRERVAERQGLASGARADRPPVRGPAGEERRDRLAEDRGPDDLGVPARRESSTDSSSIDCCRPSGRFTSARSTICSTSGGSSGRSLRGGTGASLWCFMSVASGVSPSKGSRPVRVS